jgi:hypothetical protein
MTESSRERPVFTYADDYGPGDYNGVLMYGGPTGMQAEHIVAFDPHYKMMSGK